MLVGGQSEDQACADLGARTPIGAIQILTVLSCWVRIKFATEIQLPRLPGSELAGPGFKFRDLDCLQSQHQDRDYES